MPYVADAFITADDTKYYNLAGVAINDPIIGDSTIQQGVVLLPFVEYWNNLLFLNDTTMETLRSNQDYCNYTSYYNTYFTFPPAAEDFPVLPPPSDNETRCQMFTVGIFPISMATADRFMRTS